MTPPIQLISTDFDGTLFAEFENPPVPAELQQLIGSLQARGVCWVINTGRDMSSLMETLGRAHLSIRPDFLVLVEREIYRHEASRYVSVEDWNRRCHAAHAELFTRVRPHLPQLTAWINARFDATVYEDAYSPFCLIAASNADADAISAHLDDYCRSIPNLTVVRNDVYARFSHTDFSKGTALVEIGRRLGVGAERTLAAGDHFNDLPMLSRECARYLVAPSNAIDAVKISVREQGGFLSEFPCGAGLAQGIRRFLNDGA